MSRENLALLSVGCLTLSNRKHVRITAFTKHVPSKRLKEFH